MKRRHSENDDDDDGHSPSAYDTPPIAARPTRNDGYSDSPWVYERLSNGEYPCGTFTASLYGFRSLTEEIADEDPRSETSIIFENNPMGDMLEIYFHDDEYDEIMSDVTQLFLENSMPSQYGEGMNDGAGTSRDTESSHRNGIPGPSHGNGIPGPSHGNGIPGPSHRNGIPGPSHGNGIPGPSHGNGIPGPSHGFWTNLPIEGASSIDDAIILIEKKRRKQVRFNAEEICYTAMLDTDRLPEDVRGMSLGSVIHAVRQLFSRLLSMATANLEPQDLIRFVIFSEELDIPISTMLRQVSEMTVEMLLSCVMKVIQSKKNICLDEAFSVDVVTVKRPRGGARNRRPINPEIDRLTKTSIVSIDDEGSNLCCAMALLLGKAYLDNDPDLRTLLKKDCTLLLRKAMHLHSATGVPEGNCGFAEVAIFERALDIQAVVIGPNNIKEVGYKGSEKPKKVYLWLHDNHFDLIRSPKGFYGANFYCEFCNVPYKNLIDHACTKLCHICRRSECLRGTAIRCMECDRNCASNSCYNAHIQNGICNQIWQCRKCCKVMEKRKCTKYEHVCGETKCKGCSKFVGSEHKCFLPLKPPKSPIEKLIFFDFETDQSSGDHVVNFVVAQYSDGEEIVFEGYDALDQFCLFLFHKKHKGYTVLAHNLKGFDGQFILRWLLEKGHEPQVIPQGSKLMCIKFTTLQMTFIDSFNFLPMGLSKFPKTFGLTELTKGYFPHLFNTEANQNYVGTLPPKEFFSPDTMSSADKLVFMDWYDRRQSEPFDFRKEMLLYCRSDVDILRRCCMDFRAEFMTTAGVDPFCYVTIASACMACFRSQHIGMNSIAMIPQNGYIKGNYSNDAIRWIEFTSQEEGVFISHALNGMGEKTICGVKVDGFCEETNTIYQYHGCFFHGCDECFDRETINPLSGSPMHTLKQKTSDMTEMFRSRGYLVIEMWEHTFQSLKRTEQKLKNFVTSYAIVDRLKPRDAFYGGRTNAVKLTYEGTAKYIDFTSLYPWCNKYCRYPVGHPEIILPTDEETDISQYFGIIKCTVLPPRKLYHPVLPYRQEKKLMFPLCRTCCENLQQESCEHVNEERCLTGTWVTEEVKKAVEMGYVVLKIHEVYHFSQTSTSLFNSYIDTFLKIKQESSGWPSECTTDAEKEAYLKEYHEKEGIKLNPESISFNPGKRAVAKLALNSFWGRWGMNRDKSQLSYIRSLEKFNSLLTDKVKNVQDVYFPSEAVCAVQWRMDERFLDQDVSTNIFLAAFTTCHARLKLYGELEKLDGDVLYFDTDSIIYKSDGTNDPPLGNFLGEFTDELDGETIEKFISGGPKNYAYSTATKTVCKVRGFSLNFKNSLKLNFDSMKHLILNMNDEVKIPIINERKICRDPKRRRVFNRVEIKNYGIVYDKRVIQENFDTLPYGF